MITNEKPRFGWRSHGDMYNNGFKNRRFIEGDIIPPGFVRGELPRKPRKIKPILEVTYNNGEINKPFKIGEVIPEGWFEGKVDHNKYLYTKDNMYFEFYTMYSAPKDWVRVTNVNKDGYKYYNNEIKTISLPITCISPPKGYKEGRVKLNYDTKWYNNGDSMTRVRFDESPPDGFVDGRLKYAEYLNEPISEILTDYKSKLDLIMSLPEDKRTYKDIYLKLKSLYPDTSLPETSVNMYFGIFKDEYLHRKSSNTFKPSGYEKSLVKYLKSLGVNNIKCNSRFHWLKFDSNFPKELDIYLPDYNLAIEFNGLYSHSKKSWNYHMDKSNLCRENGVHLLHIFEHEWIYNKVEVKNYIKYLLSNKLSLQSDNLVISKVDYNSAKDFMNKYHILSFKKFDVCYGLYYNNELMSIMSFCKLGESKWELSRYCVNYNFIIKDSESKLFDEFVNNYNPKVIVSYCDFSKFTGKLYSELGFKLIKNSPLCQYISYNGDIKSRRECQKSKLVSQFSNKIDDIDNKTEIEIMSELGYYRIFNAGVGTYIWRHDI